MAGMVSLYVIFYIKKKYKTLINLLGILTKKVFL